MAVINVWLGVRSQDLARWDGTEENPSDRPSTPDKDTVVNLFRQDIQGPTTWVIRSVYVEDIPNWKGELLKGFSGVSVRILGAWSQDGKLVHPINPRILEYIPDDIVFDDDGNETGRSRPLSPKQVNLGMGWSDREWAVR